MCSYFHPLLRYYIPGNESTQPHSVRTGQAYENSIYYLLFLSSACHPLISMSLSYLPQKHYTSAKTRHPPISFIITISSMIMQINTAYVYIYFNQLLRFLFIRQSNHTYFLWDTGTCPLCPTIKKPLHRRKSPVQGSYLCRLYQYIRHYFGISRVRRELPV